MKYSKIVVIFLGTSHMLSEYPRSKEKLEKMLRIGFCEIILSFYYISLKTQILPISKISSLRLVALDGIFFLPRMRGYFAIPQA